VRPGVADKERIAVGRRLRDARAARHARGRADVLHHDGLPEKLADVLRLDARARVDAAARRERHDERNRPCGPGLRRCDAGKAKTGQQQQSGRGFHPSLKTSLAQRNATTAAGTPQ
jgi:hypothetical protein